MKRIALILATLALMVSAAPVAAASTSETATCTVFESSPGVLTTEATYSNDRIRDFRYRVSGSNGFKLSGYTISSDGRPDATFAIPGPGTYTVKWGPYIGSGPRAECSVTVS